MRQTSRLTAVLALLIFTAVIAAAQSVAGAPARADDGDIWHVPGNVALLPYLPNTFELGAAYSPIDSSGTPVTFGTLQNGTLDVAIKSSSLAYFLFKQGSTVTNWIGGALRLGDPLSLGYAYSWTSGLPGSGQSNLGMIVRPFNFASLGLTLNTNELAPAVFGFGVALRPLVFVPHLGPWLTLTADAQVQGGTLELQDAGAHVSINRSVGLRGWYDFQQNQVGLEATVSLGPSAAHASVPSVANPQDWTIGGSVGFSPGGAPPQTLLGRNVLLINDLDAIVHDRGTPGFISRLFSAARTASFRSLVNEVRRAAEDPAIAAVVIENLPSLGGPASVQEFTQALSEVRKAGKKVYVYSSSYGNSFQFQMLASEASWIAVSPAGSVNLSGRSVRRLYLKDFLDRIGLHFVNLAPWKTKSFYNNFSESKMSGEERAMLVRYEGNLQAQALAAFAKGRGSRLKSDPKAVLAAGPFLDAQRAVDDGVVDALQYEDQFAALIDKQLPGASFVTSVPKPETRSWGPPIGARRVAVVNLSGNIVSGRGTAGLSIGTDVVGLLEKLREDKSIAAILLRVNSPGGVIVTSDEIAHQVKETVDAGKPVVVSMGDYAASGGYYISANATRIFAEPGTITGSIGVTGLLPNLSGTLKKLGIDSSGVALSQSADTLDPTIPFRARDLKLAHESILSDYARFVSTVATGRTMSRERVREIGKGQVWTGSEALSNGLVDAIGGLGAAESYLKEKLGGRVTFTSYRPGRTSPFSAVFGTGSGAAARGAVAAVLGGAQSAEVMQSLIRTVQPYLHGVSNVLELGSGPLYYFDWTQTAR